MFDKRFLFKSIKKAFHQRLCHFIFATIFERMVVELSYGTILEKMEKRSSDVSVANWGEVLIGEVRNSFLLKKKE